jgi:hypothetical protein
VITTTEAAFGEKGKKKGQNISDLSCWVASTGIEREYIGPEFGVHRITSLEPLGVPIAGIETAITTMGPDLVISPTHSS